MTPKENQKSASDFDALEPRKRGCSPLLTPKKWATPEKTEDSRLFGVKNAIFNVLTMFKINVPEKM